MFGDPNLFIGGVALAGLALAAVWRLIVWVRDAPVAPDPWDAETERKISDPETKEICPRCLTEQPPTAWFCPGCGRAVGPYNNMMPFVQIFSEGEVFRNGTSGRIRKGPVVVIGYFLIAVCMYSFLAPIFLISLFLNWHRRADQPDAAAGPDVQP